MFILFYPFSDTAGQRVLSILIKVYIPISFPFLARGKIEFISTAFHDHRLIII